MSASEEEKKPNVAGGLVIVALCVGLAIWMMAKDPFGGTLSESLLIGLVFAALFAIYYGVRLMGADRLLSGIAAFFLFSGGIHAGDLMSQDGCTGAHGGGEECEDPLPEPEIAAVDGKSGEATESPASASSQPNVKQGPGYHETISYIGARCKIDNAPPHTDRAENGNSISFFNKDRPVLISTYRKPNCGYYDGLCEDMYDTNISTYKFDISYVDIGVVEREFDWDAEGGEWAAEQYKEIRFYCGDSCISLEAWDELRGQRVGEVMQAQVTTATLQCRDEERVVKALERLQELAGGKRRDPFAE